MMTIRRTVTFGSGRDGAQAPNTTPEVVESQDLGTIEPDALPLALRTPPLSDSYSSPYTLKAEANEGPAAPDKCTNVIAARSNWKSSLAIEDSVRIDGHFSGDIEAKGTINIADGAVVEAKIKASFVVISGSFKGEVRCLERLELLPRSKVEGELITKVLNIHEF